MRTIVPRQYVCHFTADPFVIDGQLNEAAWEAVAWTDTFVDIEGSAKPVPRHRTRIKMRWTDQELLIGAQLEEPHLWATLTEHDSVMFHDNDFEVFLDPDGDRQDYGELEINAHNATWDLLLPRTYRDGGRADNRWEIDGLRTAVHLNGTLNDPSDQDHDWTLEIAIPWSGLAAIRGARVPREGDMWRVNFSRVQWDLEVDEGQYRKIPDRREHNWVWSPQGIIDMHRPERWGELQFSKQSPGAAAQPRDPDQSVRERLMDAYYRQRESRQSEDRPALDLKALESSIGDPRDPRVVIYPTRDGRHPAWEAVWLTDQGQVRKYRVTQAGRLAPVTSVEPMAIEREVNTELRRQVDAWNAGDLASFLAPYWRSAETTMHADGALVQGFWRIEERYRSKYPTPDRMGNLSLDEVHIEPLGDDACLVRGTWQVTRGTDEKVDGHFSLVWQRIDGLWRIVHDHTS